MQESFSQLLHIRVTPGATVSLFGKYPTVTCLSHNWNRKLILQFSFILLAISFFSFAVHLYVQKNKTWWWMGHRLYSDLVGTGCKLLRMDGWMDGWMQYFSRCSFLCKNAAEVYVTPYLQSIKSSADRWSLNLTHSRVDLWLWLQNPKDVQVWHL